MLAIRMIHRSLASGPARNIVLLGLVLLPTVRGLLLGGHGRSQILELGWTGVVAQTSPNTCGPAVLATLLQMEGNPVSETTIALQADLLPEGVTLAEFARLSATLGLPGNWFEIKRSPRLAELPVPSVIHSNGSRGHFSIFLGSSGGFVRLADPARGGLIVRTSTFRRMWSGRLFVFDASPSGV